MASRAECVESALLWLGMLEAGVIVHQTVGVGATADYLSRLSVRLGHNMGQAKAASALEAIVQWSPDYATLKLLGNASVWQSAVVRAYFAMLCAIPGCTARHALAVMRQYPTLPELLGALASAGAEKARKLLLKDLQVQMAHGGARNLGPAVSERIYVALMCTDKDTMLRST